MSSSVRAIVMINLQTYMGGRDLWGLHDHHMPEEQVKNLKKPIFDDGLLEVPCLVHLHACADWSKYKCKVKGWVWRR